MTVVINGSGEATGLNGLFKTGDFKQAMRTSTPPGWIPAVGTATIGGVGSNSTYMGVSYFALYSLWWAEFNDALCPLYTSAGAPVARGASAGADWDAQKRLTVFDAAGRFARVPGTINGVTIVAGVKYADTLRSHAHTYTVTGSVGSDGAARFTYLGNDGARVLATDATGGLETAGVSIGIPGFWKL